MPNEYLGFVYVFDCINCGQFYGEQTLNEDGALLCPVCEQPENKDAYYVERVRVNNA